jgi:2-polyprenyl-3-methyl-5-hydroxy-6-metoxy-1,4-benzoquinol methylase
VSTVPTVEDISLSPSVSSASSGLGQRRDYTSNWEPDDIAAGFARRGPWTTGFRINGQLYGGRVAADADPRLVLFDRAFPDARSVLEIGSLEGGHAFALAQRGLRVTAVEGRTANISKTRWVQQVLGARSVQVRQADLEQKAARTFGVFDVLFCSGVLHDLPSPAVLLNQLADSADGLFLWTHYARPDLVTGERGDRPVHAGARRDLSPASRWVTLENLIAKLRDLGFPRVWILDDFPEHPDGPCVTLAARRPPIRPSDDSGAHAVHLARRGGAERLVSRGRRRLAAHLSGRGVELGPGHHPFPLPMPPPVVRYIDRWAPADSAALFPELSGSVFAEPDLVADLNDGLPGLPDQSEDFVIASHIIEHLADPLLCLDEIHRVLRPGGVAMILLPDRRWTVDACRPPTPLAHIVEDRARELRAVDDDHLDEFLALSGEDVIPSESPEKRAEHHRLRSFHVHCWTETEFARVLAFAVRSLGHTWEVVERLPTGAGCTEFGWVLRRATGVTTPAVRAAVLVHALRAARPATVG